MPHDYGPITGEETTPEEVVQDAIAHGCKSISYTYTEPTIFFEFAYETAKLAREEGLLNTFVTNGYTTKEAIDTISPYLDAVNVDLKGFTEEFYHNVCGGRLRPVEDAIRQYHDNGVWVEVTTLLVSGHNDSKFMLDQMADFIVSIDAAIPWHISRFHPSYKMRDAEPTKISTIHKAVEIGRQHGIKYIYSGNVPGDDYESTFCPECGAKVISRSGFYTIKNNLTEGACPSCGKKIDGVMHV